MFGRGKIALGLSDIRLHFYVHEVRVEACVLMLEALVSCAVTKQVCFSFWTDFLKKFKVGVHIISETMGKGRY